MTNVRDNERDRVLMAFHQACEKPNTQQILEWIDRYPRYADDIRAHAAAAWDLVAYCNVEPEDVSESMLNSAYSQALNAIYNAQQKVAAKETSMSLHDIAAARHVEFTELARAMDIGRSVLADLFNGAMLRPIRKRLVDAVCQALNITRNTFDYALEITLAQPRFGHAKATAVPKMNQRTCDEIIANSTMTPERKRYWLEGD